MANIRSLTKADLTNIFYTTKWVNEKLAKKTDISNFITNAARTSILAQYTTKSDLEPITIKNRIFLFNNQKDI